MIYTGAILLILILAAIKWLCKALPQFIGTRKVLEQEIGAVKNELKLSNSTLKSLAIEYETLNDKFTKLQRQKKSSEVRTGFLGETMLPLMEQFPVDPKTMRFLGSPIDYISFDYENNMLTFVEVKTGDSQLNQNKRDVKRMVEEGRVKFVVVRLKEKGLKVK